MAVEKTAPAAAAAAAGRTVLVTGGAGYIGSHAVLQLLLAGFRAVVVDNLNNSSELAVRRVAALAGDHSRNLSFHKVSRDPLPLLLVSQFWISHPCRAMWPRLDRSPRRPRGAELLVAHGMHSSYFSFWGLPLSDNAAVLTWQPSFVLILCPFLWVCHIPTPMAFGVPVSSSHCWACSGNRLRRCHICRT